MGDASTQIPCMIRLFFALTKCDIKYFGGITLFWTCIDLFFPKMWPLTRKRSERIAVLKLIAVHLPFERTGMLFECLELSVLKNSSSVRTVRAIRLRKLISCSNGSSYPFKKNHQPFERLELSVQEIHQPFEWLKLSIPEIRSHSNKTRLQNNSPFFVQQCMPLCLRYTNSRHVSVLCLSSFNLK